MASPGKKHQQINFDDLFAYSDSGGSWNPDMATKDSDSSSSGAHALAQ